jgi:hypothetical protein
MLRISKISALVSVVILFNAVTTLLFVQNAVPAVAGPQAGNCVTGDVNGDFIVDITDPIHLLGYIFEGTPEPVACAQVPVGITADEMILVMNKFMPLPEDYFRYIENYGSLDPTDEVLIPWVSDRWTVCAAIVQNNCSYQFIDTSTGLAVPISGYIPSTTAVSGVVQFKDSSYVVPPGCTLRVYNFSANPGSQGSIFMYGHYLAM